MARDVVRSLKSHIGITGSTATRSSTYTAAARTARPASTSSDAGGRGPAEVVAGQRDPDEQQADAAHDQAGAEVVDVDLAAYDGQVQRLLQQHERRDGERQADEEAPAPAESGGVDDDATDQRAGDRGQREGRADVAGVPAALTRRDHAGDHDLHEGGQRADAEALEGARTDQHLHVRRDAGDQRAGGEDHQAELDEQLLAEQVRELAPDRRGRGHRQQRRDDHPRVARLAAAEVADDRRQRVRDDGAGEHRDEHREQQARQGLEHLAVRHLPGGLRRGDRRGGG